MNGAIELRFLLLQNLLYGSDIIDIKEQYEKTILLRRSGCY